MATTQLTASSISTRNLSSFERFRTSSIQFPRNNARIAILTQWSLPSMVVKAATVVAPKVWIFLIILGKIILFSSIYILMIIAYL